MTIETFIQILQHHPNRQAPLFMSVDGKTMVQVGGTIKNEVRPEVCIVSLGFTEAARTLQSKKSDA